MNKFMTELIEFALANYSKTGSSYSEFRLKNSDDMFNYTTAAEYLSDKGYITPLSDNILSDTIKLTPDAFMVRYQLTNEGMLIAQRMDTKN